MIILYLKHIKYLINVEYFRVYSYITDQFLFILTGMQILEDFISRGLFPPGVKA